MLSEGIIAYLLSIPELSAMIADRIYPLTLGQTPTMPAVVWNRISGPRAYSHGGDSHLTNPRYQFTCWSDDIAEAHSVAQILISAMSGYKGLMGAETVHAAFVENDVPDHDPETDLYSVIVDVTLWARE